VANTAIGVVGKPPDADTRRVLETIHPGYWPNQVVALHDPTAGNPPEFIPLLRDRPMVDQQVTTYPCENFVCAAPLVGAETVAKAFG
jgi:uncharacterized protein